jgi:activating signal cointegrator complex subunit 1
MGKKKSKGEYNDFLDGEKLTDNTEIRTTLQGFSARDIAPPPQRSKKTGKGGPKKPPLTHFLCLPLVTETSRPQLQSGLDIFKQDLAKDGIIPTKAVRPVGTLHLTLGVMSLSPPQLLAAAQYLANLDLHVLLRDITHRCVAEKAAEEGAIAENLNAAAMPDTDALTINLESLVPMQAPHKTSILYAEPQDASQRLAKFAEALRDEFVAQGLMVKDTRPLRLHATIANTIYAKPKRGGKGRPKKQDLGIDPPTTETESNGLQHDHDDTASTAGSVDSNPTAPPDPSTFETSARKDGHAAQGSSWMRFDARALVEQYKGFVWAENVRVDRVYICKMGAKKIYNEDGEVLDEAYEVVAQKGIFE